MRQELSEIPDNPRKVTRCSVLRPTSTPICPGGETAVEFVGHPEGYVVMFGMNAEGTILGGVLTPDGPRQVGTWAFDQLMHEIEAGLWRVVPIDEVRRTMRDEIFERMHKDPALSIALLMAMLGDALGVGSDAVINYG